MASNERLTNQAQGRYPKEGDIFMEDNKDAQKPPEDSQDSSKKEDAGEQRGQESPKSSEVPPDEEDSRGDIFARKKPPKERYTKKEKLAMLANEITDSKLVEIKDKLSSIVVSDFENLTYKEQIKITNEVDKEMEKARGYFKNGLIGKDQLTSLEKYNDTLLKPEDYYESMDEILHTSDKELRKEKVMELLKRVNPYSQQIDPELIEEVVKDRNALDYFVTRIIGQSMDSEESEYSTSFYGGMNLDIVKNTLKTMGERGDPVARDNYHRILTTAVAAAELHTMNLRIATGKLDGFVEGSQNIMPEKLQVMHSIKGVSEVIRLFDEEIFRLMNRDGILRGSNYDEMMGFGKDEKTGELRWTEGSIERKFRKMIQAGAVDGFDQKKLDDWQIKWALNVGKILGNISLRTSEQISLNKVQTGDYKMASWPLEKSTRLFNWLGLTGLRYGLGDVKGGIFLAKLTSDIFQRQRQENGYGKCRIKNIGWTSLGDFELAGICGINGTFQGWRSQIIVLNQARTAFSAEEGTSEPKTVREAMMLTEKFWSNGEKNGKLILKEDRVKELGFKGERLNSILQKEGAERLKEVFLKNGELNTDYFSSNLGILLKSNPLNPSGKDTEDMRKAKELIRAEIWRNVAKDNPLAILPFLQGTTLDLGRDKVKKIDITESDFNSSSKSPEERIKWVKSAVGQDWEKFADKLETLNELRMQKLKTGKYVSLKTIMKDEGSKENGVKLDAKEEEWLKNIENEGENISQDLSNIRFPSIPFMNDTVFEESDFSQAGKNYYGRRAGGDLGDFSKIGEGFGKIMTNPGGVAPKDVFESLRQVMGAIEGPLGTEFAQDRTRQFLEAYLLFIQKGGQLGVDLNNGTIKEGSLWDTLRFFSKDSLYSEVKKGMRQPTSIAQVISGVNATSADENAMRDYLDKALELSLTRKNVNDSNGIPQYIDLDKKFRKKFKVGLLGMILAFLRDVPKVVVAGMIVETGKQATKDK